LPETLDEIRIDSACSTWPGAEVRIATNPT